MERDYWLRQEPGKPLYGELAWSRPENRQQAGKLLIVGGNLYGFAAAAEGYSQAVKAGVGTARVLLPNAIQKLVGSVIAHGEFAPSTPSGSFSQKALDELLFQSSWADATLFAGDLGRNSETAILLEKFLQKSSQPAVFTKDAVDYITAAPKTALIRPDTLLVLSLSQLQRLAVAARHPKAVTFSMDLLHLVEWLHDFTTAHALFIVVKHHQTILTAVEGRVSTTQLHTDQPIWQVQTAAQTAVWWVQNPGKPFEGITAALAQT